MRFKPVVPVWVLVVGIMTSLAGMAAAFSYTDNYTEFMLTADAPTNAAAFGQSVAILGNRVLVGAVKDVNETDVVTGAAYVFRRTGSTLSQEAKLTGPALGEGAEFGCDVALRGDLAVVGARGATRDVIDADGESVQTTLGAAFIYKRKQNGWALEQKLEPDDDDGNVNFGRAVALNGNVLAVSALKAGSPVTPPSPIPEIVPMMLITESDLADETDGETGVVYVYRKKFGSWQLEQILTASDGTDNDQFGQSLEVRGEMIIVGASGAVNGDGAKSGAVYLYHRIAGTWEETAKIYADDGRDGDQFGFSVDISSGVIGVGARWADVDETIDAGAAYLFRKAEEGWTQIGKLTAGSAAAEGDEFGHSIAMTGGLIAVGANLADINGRVDQGRVHLFSRPGEGWEEIDQITASAGEGGDQFGQALAAHSNKLAVGAYATDVDQTDQGAAYVYLPWNPEHAGTKIK